MLLKAFLRSGKKKKKIDCMCFYTEIVLTVCVAAKMSSEGSLFWLLAGRRLHVCCKFVLGGKHGF